MSQLLEAKIASVRRKRAIVFAGQGFAAMAALLVILLSAGMLLDWFIDFPRSVRAAFLAVDIASLMWVFLYYVVAPAIFGPDDEQLALLVEHDKPEFRTRLIASIQLSKPGAVPAGASPGLVRAMVRQTESMAEPMDFTDVVKMDRLLKMAAAASLIVLLGLAAFAWGGEASRDLLGRAFLSDIPVPRKTGVEVVTGDKIIAIGDNITLEAVARRLIPSQGQVRLQYSSGREQTFSMMPVPKDESRFSRTIENVQESFKYSVKLNDGTSRTFTVDALPRPAVTSVEFTQEYPSYIKRPAERKSPGDLSLLAGSTLRMKVKSNKPIKSGTVRLVGLEKDVNLGIVSVKKDELATGAGIAIPAKDLTGLSIRLTDEHGIQSRNETVYPVDIVLDKPPTVRVLLPESKEELATQQAYVDIVFETSDDFGIGELTIKYRVDAPGGERKQQGEYSIADKVREKLGAPDFRSVKVNEMFKLADIKPAVPEGHTVEWWIEIKDRRNIFGGPGIAESEHFRVRIVSEVEKRADLNSKLNDQLGKIDFVTQDQEKLEKKLGALILEKTNKNSP